MIKQINKFNNFKYYQIVIIFMEQSLSPGRRIVNYLSEKGSASIAELAIYGNTNEAVAEAIVRDLVFRGKARYFRDEQDGGAKVAEWTDGF